MNLLRRRYEGIELHGTYPEPWLIPSALRWLYRALLGRPMDNVIRTDATFWRAATRGYPSHWLRRPGWQRALIRMGAGYLLPFSIVLTLLWSVGARSLALHVLLLHMLLAGAVALPIVLGHAIRSYGLHLPVLEKVETESEDVGAQVSVLRRYVWTLREVTIGSKGWEQEVVRPLARALAGQLQRPYHPADAASWVHVPRNYAQENAQPVEIRLPAHFTGADDRAKARLVRTVAAKLALHELAPTWLLDGSAPMLQLRAPAAPPKLVTFSDVAHFLERSEEFRPFLGIAAGGEALHAEMIEDSPHIGLSAGPGAGKSTFAKNVMMQALHWGWGVVVLDWKQTEAYRWARDLPGVTYLTTIEDIHDFGVRVGQEVDIRKSQGMDGRARVLVVRDEWNITADLLMAYWQDLRATEIDPNAKRVMPLKSPALRGYMALDFAGREFSLFDFLIAQRFSARIFNGNADIRECFQIRALARYSPLTKKMLVGDMKPFPKKSNHPGRWTVVAGEDVSVIQVPLVTNDEAREFALSGIPGPSSPFSSSGLTQRPNRGEVPGTQGESLGHDPTKAIAASPVPPMKLADIAPDLGYLDVTHDVLMNERKRDPEFPGSVDGNPNTGWLYNPAEVADWARKRHARIAAERSR